MDLKVGQKVRCKKRDYYLKIGETYTITQISKVNSYGFIEHYNIQVNSSIIWYTFGDWFELINENPTMKQKLKHNYFYTKDCSEKTVEKILQKLISLGFRSWSNKLPTKNVYAIAIYENVYEICNTQDEFDKSTPSNYQKMEISKLFVEEKLKVGKIRIRKRDIGRKVYSPVLKIYGRIRDVKHKKEIKKYKGKYVNYSRVFPVSVTFDDGTNRRVSSRGKFNPCDKIEKGLMFVGENENV